MDFLNQINWKEIGTFFVALWAIITKCHNWLIKHQTTIDSIVLRVEKETKGKEISNFNKKQFAKDIYVNFIKKKVPWYLALIIKIFILPKIEKYIDKACAKSHEFKEEIEKKNV